MQTKYYRLMTHIQLLEILASFAKGGVEGTVGNEADGVGSEVALFEGMPLGGEGGEGKGRE
jgi:hypothetical protein